MCIRDMHVTFSGCTITEGKTKPKPLHTESTLLAAMETAGKEIEDDTVPVEGNTQYKAKFEVKFVKASAE